MKLKDLYWISYIDTDVIIENEESELILCTENNINDYGDCEVLCVWADNAQIIVGLEGV